MAEAPEPDMNGNEFDLITKKGKKNFKGDKEEKPDQQNKTIEMMASLARRGSIDIKVSEDQLRLSINDIRGHAHSAQEIANYLKEYYPDSMSHLSINPGDPDETMPIETMYVNLKLVTEEIGVGAGPFTLLRYTDIFKDREGGKSIRRILVQGKAGAGKSSLSQKIAIDWADGKDDSLKKFENVFVISLRKVNKDQTLVSAIMEQLFEDATFNEKEMEKYIQKNEKVLIVLDGYDEMEESADITKIVNRGRLARVCVLITSAPWQAHSLAKSGKKIDRHARIEGFTEKDVKEFISKFFTNLNELGDKDEVKKKTSELVSEIESNNFEDISQIPLLLNMLCILFNDKQSLPHSISETYRIFREWLYHRYLTKNNIDDCQKESDRYMETLIKLGQLGLEGLLKSRPQLFFTQEDILKQVGSLAFEVGLISTEKAKAKIKKNTQFFFLHKSFQENTGAMFINRELSADQEGPWKELVREMTDLNMVFDKAKMLQFCAGESAKLAHTVLTFLESKMVEIHQEIKDLLEVLKQISQNTKDPKNGKHSIPSLNENVKRLLQLQAKCLINVEEPVECALNYLQYFVQEDKIVKKALHLEVLKPIEETVFQFLSKMKVEGEKDENHNESTFSANDKTFRTKEAENPSDTTNVGHENIVEEESSDERIDYVFDLERRLKQKIVRMAGFQSVCTTGPPLRLEVKVTGNGKSELIEMVSLEEKQDNRKIMENYITVKEIENGFHIVQHHPPQLIVQVNMKKQFDQSIGGLVRDESSKKILALTCNHGQDHTDVEFLTDDLNGKTEINMGKCWYQIKPDETAKSGKEAVSSDNIKEKDEESKVDHAKPNNTPELGQGATALTKDKAKETDDDHVDVTLIELSKTMLDKLKEAEERSESKVFIESDIGRKDGKRELAKLLNKGPIPVQKLGATSGLTYGHLRSYDGTYTVTFNGKKIELRNAIEVTCEPEEKTSENANQVTPQAKKTDTNKNEENTGTDTGPAPTAPPHDPPVHETEGATGGAPQETPPLFTNVFATYGDSGSAITTRPTGPGGSVMLIGIHLYGLIEDDNNKQTHPPSIAIPVYSILNRVEAEKSATLKIIPFLIDPELVRSRNKRNQEWLQNNRDTETGVPQVQRGGLGGDIP